MSDSVVPRYRLNQMPTPKQSMRQSIVPAKQVKGAGFLRNVGQQAPQAPKLEIHNFTDDDLKAYQNSLAFGVKVQRPRGYQLMSGPLRLFVAYVFPPLKTHSAEDLRTLASGGRVWKATKPDVTDNLNKPVADALQGILYTNDSQVAKMIVEKYYSADGPYLLLELGPIGKPLPLELETLYS